MAKPFKLSLLIGTFAFTQADPVRNFSINSLFSDTESDRKRLAEQKQVEKFKSDIRSKIMCDKNDELCWKEHLPDLPCRINDTECWKEKYPDLPCDIKDTQCWK